MMLEIDMANFEPERFLRATTAFIGHQHEVANILIDRIGDEFLELLRWKIDILRFGGRKLQCCQRISIDVTKSVSPG